MSCRVLVLAVVVACGGGGGQMGGSHVVTVDVVGPGSVSSTPAGIDCPSAGCTGTFTDHVTLYAQADPGATFVGWSGACTGTNPSCSLQLDADKTASAMFASSTQQTLNVTVAGPGSVSGPNISCPGGACAAAYDSGTVVTLTQTPGVNATFQGWSGACTGTGDCMVTMDQMQNVTATFQGAASMHMLSVTVNGPGTVTSSPAGINCSSGVCTAMFNATDTVTLTETPTGAASFTGWTGNCSGNAGCSVQMTQDRAVTAGFASSGFVLTVHLEGDGTGTVTSSPAGINCTTGSSVGCSYDFGASVNSVTITATPAATSSYTGQGTNGNYGCNADGYGNPCSYGLNNSGVTVNVGFSGWSGKMPFPSSLTGLALVGTSFVAVGGGGNAITSTNDTAGGHGAYWTGRYALPALNALAVQGTTYYAPRNGGHVASSTDGITWTDYAAGSNDLLGIASSGTQLVAVGKNGTIEYSSNGTTWNAATSGSAQQLNEVIYAGSQFVAIGYAGTILTSPDGITWTGQTSGATNILYGIAYTGSQYVVVGASGVVLTSTNGTTWVKPSTNLPVAAIHGIAWTGTQLVAAGDPYDQANTGHTLVFTSTNATAWTSHVTQMSNDPATRVVAPGDGNVYLLGASGSLQRSSDASTWSFLLSPGGRAAPGQGQSTQLYSIAYSGTLWVAGGQWGSIFTSPDAVTWTSRRAAPCCDFITGVQWGAGLATPVFAAVGTANSTNYILTSPDGITWTKVFPTSGTISGYAAGMAYGGSTKGFAAVGSYFNNTADQGFAITSADGVTWTASATAATDISSQISNIAYGNGLFIATGLTRDPSNLYGDGAIYTSTNGAAWTAQAITGNFPTGAAAYGNGVFTVLEPEGNGEWTSANGTTWTHSALGYTPGQGLAFGNGIFYNSALYTSTNGTAWTQVSRLPNLAEVNGGVFWSALYGAGQWVGVNANESFLTHP